MHSHQGITRIHLHVLETAGSFHVPLLEQVVQAMVLLHARVVHGIDGPQALALQYAIDGGSVRYLLANVVDEDVARSVSVTLARAD